MSTWAKYRKAGLLPYVIENGEPVFMFMISSDANFGGDRPAIAKGNIDPGEDEQDAAIREAEEELGLRASNLIMGTFRKVWDGDQGYHMTIFMCEVKDKYDFGPFHFETGSVHWYDVTEFSSVGKQVHIPIVEKANNLYHIFK